ncbi:MAG: hypothetical protein IKU26_06355 [Clostridia bacterium]|nr:hypothetical protein [Clostridia bacterium]
MEENTNVSVKPRKGFVAKDRRGNLVFFVTVCLVAMIVVAILSLLPGRLVHTGGLDNSGVGRLEMFPFVFTNEEGLLYVVRDNTMAVSEIDDSVSQCVSDSLTDQIYYIRNDILYRYDMKSNTRQELLQDVRDFVLTDKRKTIFYVDCAGNLKYYNGRVSGLLSQYKDPLPEQYYVSGNNRLLFLENYNREDGTAQLCLADGDGQVKRYDLRVNGDKIFGFNTSGKRICFYQGNDFCVMNEQGKILARFEEGTAVADTVQATLVSGTTQYVSFYQSISDHYIVTKNLESDQSPLWYFNGEGTKEIAKDIERILYYSEERDMILYTMLQQDGSMKVYRSMKGGKGEAQLSCSPDTKFLFDSQSDYLYYQLADGSLYRYNIYDVKQKSVKVASNTGLLYQYPNKPFVGYESKNGEQIYLVHSDNSIRQYDGKNEVQLYGLREDRFFLMRTYGSNRISLDYVQGREMQRLCGDVGQQIFFDEKMNFVLYTSDGKLYAWDKTHTTEIGTFGMIYAVPIAL